MKLRVLFCSCLVASASIHNFALAQSQGPPKLDGSAETMCFEIIPPSSSVLPHAPVLLNRCTGKTWLMERHRGPGFASRLYGWVPIATIDRRPYHGESAAAKPEHEPPLSKERLGSSANCFTYNKRLFCE
jgi:hypothetical protein